MTQVTAAAVPSATGSAAPAAGESFRYAAFISYRHAASDQAWARWLHGSMETYRVPSALTR